MTGCNRNAKCEGGERETIRVRIGRGIRLRGVVMVSWFGRKSVKPSIETLRFETVGWKFHGVPEPGRRRVWETGDGDAVSLHFFGIPPDLPVATRVEEIAAMYERGLAAAGGKVIECAVGTLGGCEAVRVLL